MNKYFTVGPSQIYPTVKKHVDEAMKNDIMSLSHRSTEFKNLFEQTNSLLKKFLNIPSEYAIFYFSSATECWERILENCVEKKSFHCVSGAFSTKFFEASKGYNINSDKYEFSGDKFKFPAIPSNTELITFTQNETNNGVMIPMKYIYDIKKKYPTSLISIDVVSSIPYVSIDFSKIDLTFFSLQKGFGLPAGLAVMIVSPDALKKASITEKNKRHLTTYRRFSSLKMYGDKNQTFETPNVFLIYVLNKVLQDMLKKGVTTIQKETDKKAELLYSFIATSPDYSLSNVASNFRSKTVIVATVKKGSDTLLKKLQKKGFIVGAGYEKMKDSQIRIANFPAHTMRDIKNLIELL
jgi:phosphoserine aminotransferase